jgi:cardiolipin synthase A/B
MSTQGPVIADPSPHDGVLLLQGSGEYFAALVAAIDAACHSVALESYIFDIAASGVTVAQALMRAAQRGVDTRLVVDGVGTSHWPPGWPEAMQQAGVQLRTYSPLGRLGLTLPSGWRRLHRKLCVIDERVAFCGGINVLDDFHDPNHGALDKPRLDFAVRLSAPEQARTVQAIHDALGQLWWRLKVAQGLRHGAFGERMAAGLSALRERKHIAADARAPRPSVPQASLVLRDNLRHRAGIERAYRRAIGQAQHEVLIANAYFMPGGRLRRALIRAARRGVKVRVLIQGRYEYFMQYHATQPLLGSLLKAGVQVMQYRASFLHAKVAVIDPQGAQPWATVGSSNLDPLSLLLAREANVVLRDAPFAQQLAAQLDRAMQEGAEPLSALCYEQRPLRERAADWLAYGLMRLALFLTGHRY